MPQHIWGDKTFDWSALNDAIDKATHICRTYGRIGMHSKEKWGNFRDQLYPFDGTFHSLTHPGYVYRQYWKWLWILDNNYSYMLFNYTGIGAMVRWWQRTIYNYAIQKVCKLHPHIVDEIVAELDGYEWVKPGIFGKVCGKTIHDKYWITYKEDK